MVESHLTTQKERFEHASRDFPREYLLLHFRTPEWSFVQKVLRKLIQEEEELYEYGMRIMTSSRMGLRDDMQEEFRKPSYFKELFSSGCRAASWKVEAAKRVRTMVMEKIEEVEAWLAEHPNDIHEGFVKLIKRMIKRSITRQELDEELQEMRIEKLRAWMQAHPEGTLEEAKKETGWTQKEWMEAFIHKEIENGVTSEDAFASWAKTQPEKAGFKEMWDEMRGNKEYVWFSIEE